MRRRSIHVRSVRFFNMKIMRSSYLSGFSRRFHLLSRAHGQVPYVLLTRSPLSLFGSKLPKDFVRLACIRHAASVHPEPGSNSPFDLAQNVTNVMIFVFLVRFISFEIDVSCLVFKDRLVFISLAPRSALVYNTKHTSSCQRFFKFFLFFS